jgi:aryl-alcohol dehydrogenase-like predicted oxidoreductase
MSNVARVKRFERQLGKTGISTPAMALGCYSMSNSYGSRSDDESLRVIKRAVDAGIVIVDTADYYGWGHNERLVASALSGRREDALISSKFGYVRGENGGLGVCGHPSHVRKSCEASLRNLNTDHIDIYFQHRLDPAVPIEETVGAMADLVTEGKVRFIGLCEVSDKTLRRAHAIHPITAIQAEYSLWTRDVEQKMLGVLDELGTTLMAFSPLARGVLTGRLRSLDQLEPKDVRRRFPRFSPENFPKNVALVDGLSEIALGLGCTTSQLALAWLFHADQNVVAICGSDTLEFLAENLGALEVDLAAGQVAQIGDLFSPGRVSGDRYNADLMKMLDR